MLLTKGNKVRFIHTGKTGKVSSLLGEEMVNVLMDEDGMEIPAFLEDLERFDEETVPRVKAKFVKGKMDKQAEMPNIPAPESQYLILKSEGIQLAFLPNQREDGSVVLYEIFLLNDLEYEALFDFRLKIKEVVKIQKKDKLKTTAYFKIGDLLFDQLSDNPLIEIDFWQLTTAGTQAKIATETKIRPKQFFKKSKTIPFLNQTGFLYKVLAGFEPAKNKVGEDLQSYTKRNLKENQSVESDGDYQLFQGINVDEYAHFEIELDLHIENITPFFDKMNNGEKLKVQLHHFEGYIQKAIKMGVEKVFIIHGVGKGKLKDEIAKRLRQVPEVDIFKNEYHHKYGVGATEVIFY